MIGADECDHADAQLEHHEKRGAEVEFWVACPACGSLFTVTGDLELERAHISRDEVEA
jgi:nitrite reductase/ring-hydroxylating ferredoxin subunit